MSLIEDKQKLVAILDADGCIYNNVYFYLFYYLIARHGAAIFQDAKKLEFSNELKNEVKQSLKAKVKLIRADLSRFLKEDEEEIPDEFQLINEILAQHGFGPRDRYTKKQVMKIINQMMQFYREYLLLMGQDGYEILADLLWIANQSLIVEVKQQLAQGNFNELIFMSGSNRQSYHIELINFKSTGVGLFCIDLDLFVKRFVFECRQSFPSLKITLDKFLLADIYGGLPMGESFQRALYQHLREIKLEAKAEEQHAEYVYDHTKFSLLYALIHYIGTKHHEFDIMINYFEDREDIQLILADLFHAHPDLFPANIQLRFYLYSGEDLSNKKLIQGRAKFDGRNEILHLKGTGVPDFSFVDNVKRIPILCGQKYIRYQDSINSAEQLDVDVFKQYRLNAETCE